MKLEALIKFLKEQGIEAEITTKEQALALLDTIITDGEDKAEASTAEAGKETPAETEAPAPAGVA